MTVDRSAEILKWRPHHIFCEQFMTLDFSDRGVEYKRVESRIKDVMNTDSDRIIETHEGVDELCMSCPLRQNDRCESPNGNEDAVRKFDGAILKELGLSYGEQRSVQDFRRLIEKKAPLDLCRTRCPWKTNCRVFELG